MPSPGDVAFFIESNLVEGFDVAVVMRVCHEIADQRELRVLAAIIFAVATPMGLLWSAAISVRYAPGEHDGLRHRGPNDLPVRAVTGATSHLHPQGHPRSVAARQEDIQRVLAEIDIVALVFREMPFQFLTAVDEEIHIAVGDVAEALRQFADK